MYIDICMYEYGNCYLYVVVSELLLIHHTARNVDWILIFCPAIQESNVRKRRSCLPQEAVGWVEGGHFEEEGVAEWGRVGVVDDD
jgi:hypothetical protein